MLEGSHAGATDTELFRTALGKDPVKINMWDPISTVAQVGKWTTNFLTYDATVSGDINDQERKQQLLSLEKTLVLINEGPEAKAELTHFFTSQE